MKREKATSVIYSCIEFDSLGKGKYDLHRHLVACADLTARSSPMIAKSRRCCVLGAADENPLRLVNGCRSRGRPATQLDVTECKFLRPALPAKNKLQDVCSPRARPADISQTRVGMNAPRSCTWRRCSSHSLSKRHSVDHARNGHNIITLNYNLNYLDEKEHAW